MVKDVYRSIHLIRYVGEGISVPGIPVQGMSVYNKKDDEKAELDRNCFHIMEVIEKVGLHCYASWCIYILKYSKKLKESVITKNQYK